MKRRQLVELEDLEWWPRVFRNATTGYLATALRLAGTYSVIAPRLADAIRRCGATKVVDLCSGGGGPWAQLLPALRLAGVNPEICLTDKYPDTTAFARVAGSVEGVRFESESVSATEVPERLAGFRTLFTAFHHFRPADARAILAAAVRQGQGVAVFEATARTPASLAMMLLVPIVVWVLMPLVRPIRLSTLFWTYVIPVIPAAVLFDGIVSCLRIYTPDEMKAMAIEAGGEAFTWEAGFERPPGLAVPIPYLIGIPRIVAPGDGVKPLCVQSDAASRAVP
jgi:hypothetical protein